MMEGGPPSFSFFLLTIFSVYCCSGNLYHGPPVWPANLLPIV